MNTKHQMNKAEAAPVQVAQHTPGPWKVIDGIGCGTIYSIQAENPPSGNGVLAAVLHAPDKQRPLAIAQANARLISAAPELLEAVSELIESQNDEWYCEQCDRHAPKHSGGPLDGKLTGEKLTHREGCPVLKARAAIAKAEGKL